MSQVREDEVLEAVVAALSRDLLSEPFIERVMAAAARMDKESSSPENLENLRQQLVQADTDLDRLQRRYKTCDDEETAVDILKDIKALRERKKNLEAELKKVGTDNGGQQTGKLLGIVRGLILDFKGAMKAGTRDEQRVLLRRILAWVDVKIKQNGTRGRGRWKDQRSNLQGGTIWLRLTEKLGLSPAPEYVDLSETAAGRRSGSAGSPRATRPWVCPAPAASR
jgi:hypothetical protein